MKYFILSVMLAVGITAQACAHPYGYRRPLFRPVPIYPREVIIPAPAFVAPPVFIRPAPRVFVRPWCPPRRVWRRW